MDNKDLENYIENAPAPADEIKGDVKEKVNTEPKVKIDDIPNSSGEKEESGEAVVKRLQKQVLGQSDDESEEGSDIPDAFTNACLEQGWTQEEIVEFASGLEDDELLQLIPFMMEENEQEAPESAEGQTKQEGKPKPPEATAKESAEKAEIAALKKELEDIKKEISESKKDRTAQEEVAMMNTVNQAFDEAGKDFEIFGKTEELLRYPAGPKKGQLVPTSPAMIARSAVWDKAEPFIRNGMPVADAMEVGLTWYKGANLEKDVHRKVIKDLKKHETKLSAKRSGKETVRTYESEEERKADVVREAARKAGVNVD